MLLSTVALWWLLGDGSFRVRPDGVTIEGIRLVTREAVLARLAGIEREPNILRLHPDEMLASLREMPEIRDASLSVSLPATLRVDVRGARAHLRLDRRS